MTAIPAVSRKVATMADGTLRLTVDIEPMHANEAFALFGAGNVPMALAALNVGTPMPGPAKETEPEMKGGELAKLAAMIAGNPQFHDYLTEQSGYALSYDKETSDDWIKGACGVLSKRELDHSDMAGSRFHELVRKPFLEWQSKK